MSCAQASYIGPIIDLYYHVDLPFVEEKGVFLAFERDGSPERAQELAHKSGIMKLGLISIILEAGNREKTQRINDAILELAQDNTLFFPIVSVHPADGEEALFEMQRVWEKGARILKLHPFGQQIDVQGEPMQRVVSKAGELGLMILVDTYDVSDSAGLIKLFFSGAEQSTDAVYFCSCRRIAFY